MKKIIIADFVEYNDPNNKLGNYHYANCFAKENYEVLWMSNLYNKLIFFKDKKDYKFKKSLSVPKKHKLSKNIYGFAAYSKRLYGNYPFSKNANIVINNQKYIKPNINESLKMIGFDKVDILWISNPKHYWLTNVVEYKKLVYRIPDDFTHFSAFPKSISEIENKLIDKSDYVFITSRLLEDKALSRGKKPYLLNNGVDFEFFKSSIIEYPKEYDKNSKQIVYIGAIKYWFDIELIQKLAEKVHGDIYLIGKPQIDLSVLESFDNVHILGARPYSKIPSYVKCADVAIIPFIKSELTDSVNPIKLYEYCSVGTAVVSSNIKEVEKLNAPIYLAKSHDDFIKGVKEYLTDNYDSNEIIQFAQNNSWYKRYSYAKNIIFNP